MLDCVSILAKVSLPSFGTYYEGKETWYRNLSTEMRLILCWRETLKLYPILTNFPTTPNLSFAAEQNRSPKTMSSVTCSRGNVKFNSSVSVVQRILGIDMFQLHLAFKINQTLGRSGLRNCQW